MTDKAEHTTKDIESTEEFSDEAALALKKIGTQDMAPITEAENHQVLKKIDLWLMPIVPIYLFVHTNPIR